ncbi:Pex19 protein [Rhizoclosmatium globosum]|uniref:Pex19 protein n=1 Tax=Rhizoclosmatium globosum TaxID=329046 RepID=A0A1Y2D3Q2_9FUNG|nr:Pex19 protein [Rhizoclosmatium globosum]|eukprot:ORY53847.1 Pex19 protein [Rhizoclosmatium globosum]
MEKLLADFAKASGNSADDSDNVPSADEKQHTDKKHDFHAAINDTLENLKDSKVKVETELNNSQQQEPGSEDMEAMMKELEEMMGSAEFEDMFGSVMGQLMSRDLLYEPMKDLATKYPEYLQENKSNIPKADYERYKAQHLIVVDIMKVYDDESVTGDEEQKRVGDLMQKMQELGNPPEGIMKELTPGMEVGPDGLPKFPMPGMPGGNVPDCCIM